MRVQGYSPWLAKTHLTVMMQINDVADPVLSVSFNLYRPLGVAAGIVKVMTFFPVVPLTVTLVVMPLAPPVMSVTLPTLIVYPPTSALPLASFSIASIVAVTGEVAVG